MNRLIIVGSPRVKGRSAHLADLLFESCIEECPHDEVALAPVSTLALGPCTGCDACKALSKKGAFADGDKLARENRLFENGSRCIISDDMAEVYELIDEADELVVVSPVYFAGPPSQLTALLDRLQPYFWTDVRKAPKRPATLHVIGEGGDPHGFEPLIGIVRSALSCAGFRLERVLDWVGKIDERGTILAEATDYPIPPLPGSLKAGGGLAATTQQGSEQSEPTQQAANAAAQTRPKLSLSQAKPPRKQSETTGGPRRKDGKGARTTTGSGRKHSAPGNRGGKRRG